MDNAAFEAAVADRLAEMREGFGDRPGADLERAVGIHSDLSEAVNYVQAVGPDQARIKMTELFVEAEREDKANEGNFCQTFNRSGALHHRARYIETALRITATS